MDLKCLHKTLMGCKDPIHGDLKLFSVAKQVKYFENNYKFKTILRKLELIIVLLSFPDFPFRLVYV